MPEEFAWRPEYSCGPVCTAHISLKRPFPPAWSHGHAADCDDQIFQARVRAVRHDVHECGTGDRHRFADFGQMLFTELLL